MNGERKRLRAHPALLIESVAGELARERECEGSRLRAELMVGWARECVAELDATREQSEELVAQARDLAAHVERLERSGAVEGVPLEVLRGQARGLLELAGAVERRCRRVVCLVALLGMACGGMKEVRRPVVRMPVAARCARNWAGGARETRA